MKPRNTQKAQNPVSHPCHPGHLRFKCLLFSALFASFCSISSFAQVPLQFTYQGRLTDSNGVPVTASVTGIFRIVKGGNLMAGGQEVYAQTNGVMPDINGVFSVALGSINPIPLLAIHDGTASNRFIEAVINGETNLPRQQLLSVPYAIASESGNPPGSIIAYGGSVAPSGWLLCNGAIVTNSTYPRLFAAIGTAFGAGNNNGLDFHLPDLRGKFLRGVSGGLNDDPDKNARTALNPGGNTGNAVGSFQTHALENHEHNTTQVPHNHLQKDRVGSTAGGNVASGAGGIINNINTSTATDNSTIDITVTGIKAGASISTETRPRNVNVNFIIKY